MLDHHLLILLLLGDILAHHHVRTEPERESYDKAYRHLADDFIDALQTFLVLAEYLDIVVHEAQES